MTSYRFSTQVADWPLLPASERINILTGWTQGSGLLALLEGELIVCLCNFNGAVMCVGNALTDIPNLAFHVAPQLKSVKLSSNDLSTLPARVFSPLTALEQLYIDENQLETIAPEIFEGLVVLQHLDLRHNKLTSPASDVFDGLTNLTLLNLGRNSIKYLPPTIFHSLPKLLSLSIYNNDDNPWDCTCGIRGIARWIRHNQHVVIDKEDVMCQSPMYQLLRTIVSLRDEEFNFCDTTTVPSFPTLNELHETTQPFHTISTIGQKTYRLQILLHAFKHTLTQIQF
uniref:LRRCT domain-containing protein n=1 Tax=Seriola lalandi dorsalis TaxID=1841481 RepID=A0A3B4YH54_SERLL